MIKLLASLFIHKKDADASDVRGAYGTLCSIVGIILNLLLFAGKYLAGVLTASVAISADAFNNLSDAGSSLITLFGFRLAAKKPDPDHPYGHGRMEYISGFVVSLLILLLGFTLLKDSIVKIINPTEVEWSLTGVIILAASVLVKAYMAFYNRRYGKKFNSSAMMATSADSLCDMVSTVVVLAATLLGHFFNWNIDGWCGVAVSVFIFYNGIKAAFETLQPLLGQLPERETVDQIYSIVLADPMIIGVHDLIVHDYGPGRRFITLHAEVPADCDIMKAHDIIDNKEVELFKKTGALATIHMDPVTVGDARIDEMKAEAERVIAALSPELSLHDFRVVVGETHTNLIFDLVIPHKFAMTDSEVKDSVTEKLREMLGQNIFTVIQIDRPYI